MASPLTPVLCRRGDGCLAQRNDATCQLYEPTDQEKGRGVARAQQSRAIRFNEHLTGGGPTIFKHFCQMGLEGIVSKRTADYRRRGSSRRTRRARRCAGSAWRSGVSLGAPRPSWFCPNGKPDEGEYSHAENDNRNRPHFDNGKPSCHAPIFSAVERQR